jgi:hypothetical protein
MDNNSSKAWIGSLVGGLGLIVAMQWREFFGALELVPAVVNKWLTELPFEALSACLSFVLAFVVWLMIFNSPTILHRKPTSGANASAILAGVIISMALCWARGTGTPMAVLLALSFGFIAACLGALAAHFTWSTLAPPKEPKP